MLPSPQPYPIRPGQRAALKAIRGLLCAFAPLQQLRRTRSGHGRIETHRYGTRADETLEILMPEAGVEERSPVVYIHGGGWIFGHKEFYSADLAFLTECGYRVYNLDYPLAPEHPFPIPLLSLLSALRFIAAREGDSTTLSVMGDSAGGNLAMMLGLVCADPERFAELDPALPNSGLPGVRSIISLYGVLDRSSFVEHRFPGARLMLQSYGGPGAFEPQVGPELSLTPMDVAVSRRPPCLLAIGTQDPLAESSRIAYARLSKDAESVELIEYEGERHGFFNMGWRPAAQKLRADVMRFLDET